MFKTFSSATSCPSNVWLKDLEILVFRIVSDGYSCVLFGTIDGEQVAWLYHPNT